MTLDVTPEYWFLKRLVTLQLYVRMVPQALGESFNAERWT